MQQPREKKPSFNTIGKMRGPVSPIYGDSPLDSRKTSNDPNTVKITKRSQLPHPENYETKPTPELGNKPEPVSPTPEPV